MQSATVVTQCNHLVDHSFSVSIIYRQPPHGASGAGAIQESAPGATQVSPSSPIASGQHCIAHRKDIPQGRCAGNTMSGYRSSDTRHTPITYTRHAPNKWRETKVKASRCTKEPEKCPWTETGPGRDLTQLLVPGLLLRRQMNSAADMRVPAMSHELRLVSQVCRSTCAVPTSHVTRKAMKQVKATACQALTTYLNKVYKTHHTRLVLQCFIRLVLQDWCCNTMHHTRLVLQYNASHEAGVAIQCITQDKRHKQRASTGHQASTSRMECVI